MTQKAEGLKLALGLENYWHDAKECVGQGGCKFIDWIYVPGWDFSWRCPPWQYYGFDAYGANGKMKIVHDLLTGDLDYGSPTLRKTVYACSLCGSCDVGCKRNLELEVLMVLESLRARLVEKGNGPMPEHGEVTGNIEKSGNYYGRSQSERLNWLPRDIKPAKRADLLYYVGDHASFRFIEIAQAAVKIFRAAGIDFMLMPDERSSGNLLYTTGQMDKARKLAEENIRMVEETGCKTVVFSSAEDYKTFKVDYPKLLGISTIDLPFEPKHLIELADTWVQEGRLKLSRPIDLKITYHDDCNLAWLSEPWLHWEGERGDWGVLSPPRQVRRGSNGIYDAPRNVLRAIPGLSLVEMPRHHENAFDCGAGGGVKEAFPDLARWSADERLREASTTGAQAILSTSPLVKENLSQSENAKKYGIQPWDILEVIARALADEKGGAI